MSKVKITITVDESVLEVVNRRCVKEDRSRSWMINNMLKENGIVTVSLDSNKACSSVKDGNIKQSNSF